MKALDLWRKTTKARWVLGVIVGLIIIWDLAVRVFSPAPFMLPAPAAVLGELIATPAVFAKHTGYTVGLTLIAFVLAVILGVLTAVAIVYSTFVERTLYTLLVALNSVPKVALAPLFVIWLGTGSAPKIAIAFTIAIFSIVIDTVLGLRSVDPEMINLARANRASEMQILFKLRLPNALPSIFAGMKVAISFALVGTIVGEFIAGDIGLGNVILVAQGAFNTARVFGAIVLLAIAGTMLFYVVESVERLMLPWHVSQRSPLAHGGSL